MFTGIIETIQSVQSIQTTPTGMRLGLPLGHLAEDARYGDSIAINGVCLTINQLQGAQAYFDIMTETIKATTISELRPGHKVNLERAMAANGRFGGHFVQGHVDGIGKIEQIDTDHRQWTIWITPPVDLISYMIPKGSIAVDGISLTIARLENDRFAVSLIPTTLKETNLGERKKGDHVNLETDIIGKWINRSLNALSSPDISPSQLTLDKLRDQGFV